MFSRLLHPAKRSRVSETDRGARRYAAMAETALDAGDLEMAIECYRAALELSPFNEELREGLADALMMQAEESTAARKKARRAAAAPPPQADTPRPRVRNARTQQSVPRQPAPRPDAGMAAMDEYEAQQRRRARQQPLVARDSAPEVEDEFEDTDEAPPPPKRASHAALRVPREAKPRRARKSRFVLATAIYTALSLVLLGVAHGIITHAFDAAPLPEVPKVQQLPDAVAEALDLATRELSRGNPAGAITILERTLAEFPEHDVLLNGGLAQSLRALGNKQLDGREYARAAETFERATRVDPLNAGNWIELGRSFREHGRSVLISNSAEGARLLERARESYFRALEVAPDNPAALVGLAQVYLALNDRNKAVESYRKVLDTAPDSKEAGLARTHLAMLVGTS